MNLTSMVGSGLIDGKISYPNFNRLKNVSKNDDSVSLSLAKFKLELMCPKDQLTKN